MDTAPAAAVHAARGAGAAGVVTPPVMTPPAGTSGSGDEAGSGGGGGGAGSGSGIGSGSGSVPTREMSFEVAFGGHGGDDDAGAGMDATAHPAGGVAADASTTAVAVTPAGGSGGAGTNTGTGTGTAGGRGKAAVKGGARGHGMLSRERRWYTAWFVAGMVVIGVGVGMHLEDLAAMPDFTMMGMPDMDTQMVVGMVLLPVGVAMAAFGLLAGHDPAAAAAAGAAAAAAGDAVVAAVRNLQPDESLSLFDDMPFGLAQWQLMVVLTIALVVDVMKPQSLGFVLPGMKAEYGLSDLTVSAFPTTALAGTVVGSLVWGACADRYGRRPAIVFASAVFIATTVCAAMPSFQWNLAMCAAMGMAAGGMLPIVFTLMSEMTPVAYRGTAMVVVGGLGTAGGYAAASGLSSLLVPLTSWRILWVLNLPTGALIILLMAFIPESPRFLLRNGRYQECAALVRRFNPRLAASIDAGGDAPAAPRDTDGIALPADDGDDAVTGATTMPSGLAATTGGAVAPPRDGVVGTAGADTAADAGGAAAAMAATAAAVAAELDKEMASDISVPVLHRRGARLSEVACGPYSRLTAAICAYAFAWGLCNNGFVLWIPKTLRSLHVEGVDALLAYSAVITLAAVPVAAAAYGRWSSRKTVLAAGGIMVAFLGLFVGVGATLAAAHLHGLLFFALIGLTLSATILIAVLMPYTAEVYPTAFRARASGLMAAASKLAGVFAPSLMAAVGEWEPLRGPALVVLVVLLAALATIIPVALETRGLDFNTIQSTLRATTPASSSRSSARGGTRGGTDEGAAGGTPRASA